MDKKLTLIDVFLLRLGTLRNRKRHIFLSTFLTLLLCLYGVVGIYGTDESDIVPLNRVYENEVTAVSEEIIKNSMPQLDYVQASGDSPIEPLGIGMDPVSDIDSQGNIHIAFTDFDGNDYEIYYLNNVEGRFGLPIKVTDNLIPDHNAFLRVDSKGDVHIAYETHYGDSWEISYSYTHRSEKEGFSGQIRLTHNFVHDWNPMLCIDKNDNIHIAWEGYISGTNSGGDLDWDIFCTNNIDGYFTQGIDLTPEPGVEQFPYLLENPIREDISLLYFDYCGPDTNSGEYGEIYEEQQGHYYISAIDPDNMPPPIKFSKGVSSEFNPMKGGPPKGLISSNGFVHIVYPQGMAVHTNPPIGPNVFYVNNKSGVFCEPVRIGPDHVTLAPSIDIDSRGSIYIAYASRNFLGVSNPDGWWSSFEVYYTHSLNDEFIDPIKITDTTYLDEACPNIHIIEASSNKLLHIIHHAYDGAVYGLKHYSETLQTNKPPILNPIGNRTGNEATNFVISKIVATDPDNDPITIEASSLPNGARFFRVSPTNIGRVEYKLSWPAKFVRQGVYENITFTARDSSGATDSETITITINDTQNFAPTLVPIRNRTGIVGRDFVIKGIVATDFDNDPITIEVQNAPPRSWVVQTSPSNSGRVEYKFVWKAAAVTLGVHTVTFIAKDPQGATDTEIIDIAINENDTNDTEDLVISIELNQASWVLDGVKLGEVRNNFGPDGQVIHKIRNTGNVPVMVDIGYILPNSSTPEALNPGSGQGLNTYITKVGDTVLLPDQRIRLNHAIEPDMQEVLPLTYGAPTALSANIPGMSTAYEIRAYQELQVESQVELLVNE